MQILHYLIFLVPIFFLAGCGGGVKGSNGDSGTIPTANQPILQLDPGGHKALIRNIAFTPDGRSVVSASNDKFIRVWDLSTGHTIRTLRGQIGAGPVGKISAMALSPDGRWLAAGGWLPSEQTEYDAIRLYDFASGKLVALLSGHSSAVLSLVFSPDSRLLVSGSSDQAAIIWDVERQEPLQTLFGHTNSVYAVAFTPDSKRVVTGSHDRTLRLWDVEYGELIATLEGHSDKVWAVAVSPQDGTIVSGSADHTIRIWDGQKGGFLKTLANQGTVVSSLTFSPDGAYLVSTVGGGFPEHCFVWSYPYGKEVVSYKGHDGIVPASAISPDGRWVATGGGKNHEIHLWSLYDGLLKQRLGGVGASVWAVGFSADGKDLAWGKTPIQEYNQAGKLEYRLAFPTSKLPLGAPKAISVHDRGRFVRARTKWEDWSLHAQQGNGVLEIRYQNRTVTSIKRGARTGYYHRSYTFTPDGQRIISGGANGVLIVYNRDGEQVSKYLGHTSDVWAVAVSPDGRWLASASSDQTVRLWDIQSGKNLFTLFHGSDGEWLAWTSTGHYTASPNGDRMVGWQVNRGIDRAADYVSAAQLRDHFYRPDIVDSVLRLPVSLHEENKDESVAILNQLKTALPPQFKIVKPANNSTTQQEQIQVVLSFAANSKPVTKIDTYVNGSLVEKEKFHKGLVEEKITVPLQPGVNKIRIVTKNSIGTTSQELQVRFEWSDNDYQKQGNLYFVAIGVSKYQNSSYNLRYAADDARELHDYLIEQQAKVYQHVDSVLLADGAIAPTAVNIKAALKLFSRAKPDDTVVLFLSGHGDSQGQNYYFIPHDAQSQGNSWNPDSVIKWSVLQDALQNAKGRRLFFVDTCHAGGAFNPRLVKDAADSNIVVLSATDRDSVAQELPSLGHGVFTYALLEGLRGKADFGEGDGVITIKELDAYLSLTIESLTEGIQVPVLHAPAGFKNFVFARL